MEVNIRPRLSHSNSFGNDAEKDTAGCRALIRKYIVIEEVIARIIKAVQKITDMSGEEIKAVIDTDLYAVGMG